MMGTGTHAQFWAAQRAALAYVAAAVGDDRPVPDTIRDMAAIIAPHRHDGRRTVDWDVFHHLAVFAASMVTRLADESIHVDGTAHDFMLDQLRQTAAADAGLEPDEDTKRQIDEINTDINGMDDFDRRWYGLDP